MLSNLMTLTFESIEGMGKYVLFCKDVFKRTLFPPMKAKQLILQMEFIGVKSFSIIVLASIMIGAVFGIQFGKIFKIFGAESLIGAAASFALSKELAPVIGSFLVAGRAGSAMAAEIATMKVNDQLDAMRIMAVNPIAYLVSPRVVASIIMMPLLTGLFLLCGIASAFFMGVVLFDVDVGVFFEKIKWISHPLHIWQGLQKAMAFGALFSTIGCYKGFYAVGGARGVGRSTTEAVVYSLVAILLLDFVLSYFQLESAK